MSTRAISKTTSLPAGGDLPPEPISPELCLVCPELAEWARRRLPDYDLEEPEGRRKPRPPSTRRLRLPTQRRQRLRQNQGPLPRATPVPPRRSGVRLGRSIATAFALVALAASTALPTPGRDAVSYTAAVAAEREPLRPPDADGPGQRRLAVVVPDVCRKAYVFAKGLLQDWGFAWRVTGNVQGFAANFVTEQRPAPGTLVVSTGAPLIELRLARNPHYRERGKPENGAPYVGTTLREATPARLMFDLSLGKAPVLTPCERGDTAAGSGDAQLTTAGAAP